ncbi:LSM domain-containing protein, partial [Spraguea lophii 42_110]
MLFYTFFKTLIGKRLCFELKNTMIIVGRLESVDNFLNIKISMIKMIEPIDNPILNNLEVVTIRGSGIKIIRMCDDINLQSVLDGSRYK